MRKFFSGLLGKLKPGSSKSTIDRFEDYIARFPDDKIEEQVLPLLESLSPPEASQAIKLLEEAGFIKRQITMLVTSGSQEKKLKAIKVLQQLGIKEGFEAMVEAMKDPREEIKWALTEALKKSPYPSITSKLVQTLNSPNQWLPSRIAEICMAFGKDSLPYLIKELKHAKNEVKPLIIEILGELKNQEAVGEIKKAYFKHEENQEIQAKAVEALGKIASPEGRDVLEKALWRPDPKIKIAAIQALSNYGQEKDGELLLGFLTDKDSLIRIKAGQALKQLGWKLEATQLKILGEKKANQETLEEVFNEVKNINKVS